MRWGYRKHRATISGRQAVRKAKETADDAWRKTTTEQGGKLIGKSKSTAVYKNPVAKMKGKKAASEAHKEAFNKSIQESKAHNKQVRAEKKQAKKDVNQLYKGFNKTQLGAEAATAAAMSKFQKSDYETAARLMKSGRLAVQATFKKNLKDKSLDVYVSGEKNPSMRITLEKGEQFSMKFLDKNGSKNYNDFVKYYNKQQ